MGNKFNEKQVNGQNRTFHSQRTRVQGEVGVTGEDKFQHIKGKGSFKEDLRRTNTLREPGTEKHMNPCHGH